MIRHKSRVLLVCMAAALAGSALVGCSSNQTMQPTAQQAASFKGGPMPPGFRQKMQEAQRAAQTRAQSSSSAPAQTGGTP